MSLTLLLGAARSGKSRLAVEIAKASALPVTVVVTAEERDEEMRERIRRHRAERPAEWQTVEAPLDLETALREAPPTSCVILDCLTLWVANLLEAGLGDAEIERRADAVA